jgi:predicted transcriptional regulator
MSNDPRSASAERTLAAKIVSAYVRHNQIAPDQMSSLISIVHETLRQLGKPAEAVDPRTPAVSIRRSVTPGFVICLDCGWKGQVLRRHLGTHRLTIEQYRERWSLPIDHPMTAPSYSERRSAMAKQIGLGRGNRSPSDEVSEDENPKATQPRRRGRPGSTAAPD